jgi:hypothetical protein
MGAALELADALESVGREELDVERVIQNFRDHVTDPIIDVVLANLWHFAADADIRAEDTEYREMQLAELRKLVTLLRTAAGRDEIALVTFLGTS